MVFVEVRFFKQFSQSMAGFLVVILAASFVFFVSLLAETFYSNKIIKS